MTRRAGPDAISVEVSDHQRHLRVDPDRVDRLVRRVLEAEGVDRASISVVLMDDAAIRAENRRHLGHDWPTDVITFRLSEPGEPELSAELLISAETAIESAAGLDGRSPMDELALYVVHGLLHLLGEDDKAPADAERMRAREADLIARAWAAGDDRSGGQAWIG